MNIITDEIELRPAVIFAFFKSLPLLLLGMVFLVLAWYLSPYFLFFSLALTGMGWYRFLYIRNIKYRIRPEVLEISKGIFFKRKEHLEMYRIKDYVITQPLSLQIFKLMNVTLKSTDADNAVVWLRGIPESDIIETIRDHVQQARQHNRILEIN